MTGLAGPMLLPKKSLGRTSKTVRAPIRVSLLIPAKVKPETSDPDWSVELVPEITQAQKAIEGKRPHEWPEDETQTLAYHPDTPDGLPGPALAEAQLREKLAAQGVDPVKDEILAVLKARKLTLPTPAIDRKFNLTAENLCTTRP